MFTAFEFTTKEALKRHLSAQDPLASKIDAVIEQLEKYNIFLQDQTPQFKAKLCLLLQKENSTKDIADRLNNELQSVNRLKASCPDVNSELIDGVTYELMLDQHCLYWERQDDQFGRTLIDLLREKPVKLVDIIVNTLVKSINEGRGATNAQLCQRNALSGYDVLGPRIGQNFIDDFCVQRLLALIGRKSRSIEILAPMGFDSQANFLEMVRPYLESPYIQHIMFPFCNRRERHWYLVTISKTVDSRLNIEVFNPTCGSTDSIYKFFDETLVTYTKTPFTNSNQLIQPQRDGWSCGYYASAYAHLKIKQLDNSAECNPNMIDALIRYGNRDCYLRDVCLNAVNPRECSMPNEPEALTSFFSRKQPSQLPEPATLPKSDLDADFDSLFTRPITPETNWNLRGIQQAAWLTLLTEGLILTGYFTLTVMSCMNPAMLGAVMIATAMIVITTSNHFESLTM